MRQLTLFDFIEYEYDIPAEVRVLSLFDGMSCGMIAMLNAGLTVKSYDAYEIDKYAIKAASHNFPMIQQRGDVFSADFTQYEGVDYVIGGSPCTYWSIAQKNNRETEASGMGWELFQQYVRAVREAKPKYFIYENNKSMSSAIRRSITETFGFEPICINSALVSAQNRQRLYWVGKQNADGTYGRVNVEQPEDKGILLRDILETGADLTSNNKSFAFTASYDGATARNTLERQQRNMVAEPVNITIAGKAQCLRAGCYKDGIRNTVGNNVDKKTCVAEPVCVAQRGRYSDTGNRSAKETGTVEQFYEAREDGKTNAVTTAQKDNAVAEPVCMRYVRTDLGKTLRKEYEAREIHHGFNEHRELQPRDDGKSNTLSTVPKDNQICEPVRVGSLPRPNGELSNSQALRVYSIKGKSVNPTSGGGGQGAKTGLYAIPIEFNEDIPTKAVSCADGKVYTVYEVRDGQITIKDKQYPIKLADGFYIIRKLTVSECKRLQTVPEWYDFSVVSNSQAYKMLGNGWTCDVISHLIRATRRNTT